MQSGYSEAIEGLKVRPAGSTTVSEDTKTTVCCRPAFFPSATQFSDDPHEFLFFNCVLKFPHQ